jgi:GT2 family glycosyltransferase
VWADPPRVAVAVVTYNHKTALLALLDFLERRAVPTFVTENACSDGTRDAVRDRFVNVSLLESPANLGGCGGFNCAVLAALSTGSDYVLLIDDDALPVDDCIERLADFLDAHPDYVFASPAVYMSSRPDTLQEAGGGVNFANPCPVEAWYRFQVDPQLPPSIDIDYASACCLMVRSDAVMKLGVMDWNYFIFSDDVDWSLRLRRSSAKKAACVTTAKVFHDFPWAKPFSPMRLYFFQRNGLYLLSRLREGEASEHVVRSTVLHLLRRWFYSRMVGDRETAHTLGDAFTDAWRGRYGKWRTPVPFPERRAKLDASYFRGRRIKRVLLDVTIEDFDTEVLRVIRELGGNAVTVDVLCDAHRVEVYRQKNLFEGVYGRAWGRLGPLRDFRAAWRRRYDLTVTDAAMEPRRPASMSGRQAAFFHDGALYQARASGMWSCVAFLAAAGLARVASKILHRRFLTPPPPGRPPKDAHCVLERIGVSGETGQPWARDWTVPFPEAPVADATVLRVPAPHANDPGKPAYSPPVIPPGLGPGEEIAGYQAWCEMRDRNAPSKYAGVEPGPVFSVLVRLRNPPTEWLQECMASVRSQSYPAWELFLVGDASAVDHVDAGPSAADMDGRIKITFAHQREGLTALTNRAAQRAVGDYLVFLGDSDILDTYALAAFAQAWHECPADLLYADEDEFDERRQRINPVFKPDYSPDKLLAFDYIHRPVAVRRSLFEQIGGLRAADEGCPDYDLLLRTVNVAREIRHVPDVLYHTRLRPGVTAGYPQSRREVDTRPRRAMPNTIKRRGADGSVSAGAQPTLSVLVLSEGPTAEDELRKIWTGCECLLAPVSPEPAAQKVNALAERASGDVLVVASSEIRPMNNWREVLLPSLLRTGIGLVGGKLTYHDNRVYAAGLVLGMAGAVGRWHHGSDAAEFGCGGWLSLPHEVSALPWQFLAVQRGLFLAQGGFDAAFAECGFDVDLALRLRSRLNLRHLSVPDTGASFAPGYPETRLEAWPLGDLILLWERWGKIIRRGDPYLNINFSLAGEEVCLLSAEEDAARARGVFQAYDRPTVERLARRFPGRLRDGKWSRTARPDGDEVQRMLREHDKAGCV